MLNESKEQIKAEILKEIGQKILRDVLGFKNPEANKYKSFERHLRTAENWERETEYISLLFKTLGIEHELISFGSWLSEEKESEMQKIFEEIKRNRILIDLGSGEKCDGAELAEKIGVQTYIGVEKYAFPEYQEEPTQDIAPFYSLAEKERILKKGYFKGKEGFEKMDFIVVKSDILDFVSKMQPGQYNFLMSGLDLLMESPDDEYQKAVAKEVKRVCQPGSIILSNNSDEISDHLSEKFKEIYRFNVTRILKRIE